MTFASPKYFIDASVFMGMHAVDSRVREQSLGLMSRLFNSTVYMNYEQVGACDDLVWTFSREIQDQYYPFMDCLHSQMDIQRIPYDRDDLLQMANHKIKTADLSCIQALLIAQVIRYNGILFTHDPAIQQLEWLHKYLGAIELETDDHEELMFTADLDRLYKTSECLKVSQLSFS
ncbi:MAG: DUF6190 family protein [Cellvibrionaceae bacterium]